MQHEILQKVKQRLKLIIENIEGPLKIFFREIKINGFYK